MADVLTWHDILAGEKDQPYFVDTMQQVAKQRAAGVTVYPPASEVFNAFRLTKLHEVKVVILGQDPYHGPGQAHGLAFSVRPGVPLPPSLQNIYKELQSSIAGFSPPAHGCLAEWALQGVLLLNSVLTVQAHKAHSHANLGWETFTDRVITAIDASCEGIIFLLWGAHAQKKRALIDKARHHVLQAPHPSPLSAHRGFFGCQHFAQANQILQESGRKPIDWSLALSPH